MSAQRSRRLSSDHVPAVAQRLFPPLAPDHAEGVGLGLRKGDHFRVTRDDRNLADARCRDQEAVAGVLAGVDSRHIGRLKGDPLMNSRDLCPRQPDGLSEPFTRKFATQIRTTMARPFLSGDGQFPGGYGRHEQRSGCLTFPDGDKSFVCKFAGARN